MDGTWRLAHSVEAETLAFVAKAAHVLEIKDLQAKGSAYWLSPSPSEARLSRLHLCEANPNSDTHDTGSGHCGVSPPTF